VSSRPDISQRRRGVKSFAGPSADAPGQEAGRVRHHKRLRVRILQPGCAQAGQELPEDVPISGATAAVGTPVSFGGIDLLRVEGGRFAEYWVSSDGLALMAQLGALGP
jgi:hypothetical protein